MPYAISMSTLTSILSSIGILLLTLLLSSTALFALIWVLILNYEGTSRSAGNVAAVEARENGRGVGS